MSDLGPFLRGLAIGFSIAAPVGPIGVLCIRRTLADGRWIGFVSGMGAATADAVHGSIAAFGVTVLSRVLVDQQAWLRLIGGLFLAYLGLQTFFSRPAEAAANVTRSGAFEAYASTLALTLTNPLTILSFAAIYAGLGAASGQASPARAAWMVAGVFLGSGAWWLTLSSGVSLLRPLSSPRALGWVNRLSGLVLAAFGVAILLGALGS
ncbi:MAG: LysE family translocator [Chloroflexota bacterium]